VTITSAGTELAAGYAGRPCVRLSHPTNGIVDVYAHGGQVLSWRHPTGDVLFLSARSDVHQDTHAGIPILFPQFGKGVGTSTGPLPQHGFARSSEWKIGEHGVDAKGRPTATLSLRPTPEIRALWPHDFRLDLDVLFGNTLKLTMRVANAGAAPFTFTGGFHSYFRVADSRVARIEGLQGLRYRDKTANWAEHTDTEPALSPNGETDRVYLAAPARLRIRDATRCLRVESSGFANVVVWNPGPELNEKFDFAPGEWSQFVCVEPATVFVPMNLPSGGSWRGEQTVCIET
jgi:glucose-6-phosphate 1-epimerase